MIGRENNDCILIQPQLLQSIEYLPESAVNARNRSKVVTRTLRLCHFRIGVGTDQQTVQRPVFVEVEVLLHTVVQRTVRTMRRVHTYHDEKRFFRVAHITLIPQIGDNLACLVQRRPFVRVVAFAVRIPVMGVLMFIECAVGVPVIKSMTALFRCVSVPCRYAVFHIFPRPLGVVGSRKVGVQLAEVGTIVTRTAEHVAHAIHIRTQ